MSRITLHHGDNRDHLRRLIDQGVRVHSVVTDPPYGLVSITKRFGKGDAAPAKFGTDGAFARASAGFMGSKWDGTFIERDPEFWALIHDILLPGGYCLAFSSPRTGHWQAVAMEMAGFVMHPFQAWAYGQGMPKDHDAAKAITAIEKTGGAAPKNLRQARMGDDYEPTGQVDYRAGRAFSGDIKNDDRPTELTEAAEAWEGWAYGAQALKPAIEPVYVGQRPFSEKNGALNILKHGVGAINIDGCRVGTESRVNGPASPSSMSRSSRVGAGYRHDAGVGPGAPATTVVGRHPANLIHDGSPDVVALFPDAPGQLARASSSSSSRKNQNCYGEMKRGSGGAAPRDDSGSAARFFNCFPPEGDILVYNAKATARDRVFVCLICDEHAKGGKPACGCVGDDGNPKIRSHPTVKPIDLMRHFVRQVTPPGGTVLDPFAGSGTTAEAARAEGLDCILMEAEDTFAADIRFRFGLPSPVPDIAALLGTPSPSIAELLG
jgi:DNA modification methylase